MNLEDKQHKKHDLTHREGFANFYQKGAFYSEVPTFYSKLLQHYNELSYFQKKWISRDKQRGSELISVGVSLTNDYRMTNQGKSWMKHPYTSFNTQIGDPQDYPF